MIGSIAAVNAGGWIDRAINVLSQAAASVPDFWLGLMVVLLFAVTLRILPS
ncbi:ABC transporter permease subunit [Rhizobium leguminosarum]|uniref:ABC transporter permease subunit n=1 Tax=Rhizobium leguminosarum TaxID=384 RepID=UPI003F9D884E